MSPERPKFAAGDLPGGTTEEKAQAAGTYVSYCGRHEFCGERAVHQVELSLFPNLVGVEQERLVEVRGDRMTLSTSPKLFGACSRVHI